MSDDEKNIKAIVKAGEVEKYDRDFFVKSGEKRWKGVSKKEKSEHGRMMALKRWFKKQDE